jgi:O-antigen/teichoic acid export membrane protein
LQRYQGVETVGYYAVAFSLANLALQLPIQLSGSLVPYYSEHLQREPTGRLPVAMFSSVVRSLAYFTMPMSFGLAAISHRLVTIVFGDAFAPSASMLAILALSVPLVVACQVGTQYMFAIDKIRERLFVGLGCAAIMLGGDILLIPSFGGEGAAFVRILVFSVMSIVMLRWTNFEGSLAPLGASLVKVTLASGFCAAAAFAVLQVLSGLAGLLLAMVAAVMAYLLALKLLRVVPMADVAVITGLFNRLPRRLAMPLNFLVMQLSSRKE